jgi:hypothetical protein
MADPPASRACPVTAPGSGPERSAQTPASTMPSSWVVSITENANP